MNRYLNVLDDLQSLASPGSPRLPCDQSDMALVRKFGDCGRGLSEGNRIVAGDCAEDFPRLGMWPMKTNMPVGRRSAACCEMLTDGCAVSSNRLVLTASKCGWTSTYAVGFTMCLLCSSRFCQRTNQLPMYSRCDAQQTLMAGRHRKANSKNIQTLAP